MDPVILKGLLETYARTDADPVEVALGLSQARSILLTEDNSSLIPMPSQFDLMMSDMTYYGDLWLPTNYVNLKILHGLGWISAHASFTDVADPEPAPAEEDYEVNLTEPLVGWRWWHVIKLKDEKGRHNGKVILSSINIEDYWPYLIPLMAQCDPIRARGCKKPPNDNCTCGIYALDGGREYSTPNDDSCIIGEVYGWGRYVRGNKGWRAQWAYPKSFYLSQHQVELIEPLKAYRVPITIAQPLTIYDPSEDGYDNYENSRREILGEGQ